MGTFKYVEIKDTKNGEDADACDFNSAILAKGVEGVKCLYAGRPSPGEVIDFTHEIPWSCYISTVERYANGAINFFVRNGDDKVIGYLIVRPFVDRDVDTETDLLLGGYDVD